MKSFLDSSGNSIQLGKELGRGGEGSVFELLSSHKEVVAKIYHAPLDPTKQNKLQIMSRVQNAELLQFPPGPSTH